MAEHTHPEYERNFDRIAVLLEKVVEVQLRQAQALEEFEKRFEAAMERLATRGAETEDKLNAVIDLMDRHIREHGKQ